LAENVGREFARELAAGEKRRKRRPRAKPMASPKKLLSLTFAPGSFFDS